MEQHFSVGAGGWLEVMPELFIPQSQCRYRQRTTIEVAAGGEMFFVETLAPGRVARGESFQFSEVEWEFALRYAGGLIARERFALRPSDESIASLRNPFPTGYYASCYVITPRISPDDGVWRAIHGLTTESVLVGVSRLVAGGSTIKILAIDSIVLARTLGTIRTLLARFLLALLCATRKL